MKAKTHPWDGVFQGDGYSATEVQRQIGHAIVYDEGQFSDLIKVNAG